MAIDGFYAPEDFIRELDISQGSYIADFGSGTGNFAVEIAQAIGRDGRVFAFDIRTAALQSLKSKMHSHELKNIRPIRADLESESGTGLPDEYVDIVLIHNIIFQVKDKEALLQEAKRILKPEAYAVAVEWEKHSPIGPPEERRMSKEKLIELFEKNGLRHSMDVKAGKYHYGVLFQT